MNLADLLGDYFCKASRIDKNHEGEIEKINARELIVPGRIDLIAKMKYVEFKEEGYDMTFVKELYKDHIEAFSLGRFTEDGNEMKNSIEDFFNTFDALIENIKVNGIDEKISVIPVGKHNQILDGSHRTAIAAFYNMDLPVIRFNQLVANYNIDFFKNRYFDEKYLDYLATEYCKLKDDTYIVICWPRIKGRVEHAEKLIKNTGEIIYKRKVSLNYNGLRNLIIQVYNSYDWIGGLEKNFESATLQIEGCYDKGGLLYAYAIKCDSVDKIKKMKEEIREIYKVGNYSVHSTVIQKETIQIANMLFNKNSIEFLNNAHPDGNIEFNKKLNYFKCQLIDNGFSLDEFIIPSSSVMGLYNLRPINDIDFFTSSKGFEAIENDFIGNHHDYISLYEMGKESIIFDPNNYFVYNELKFITLSVLREFKLNRNERKDKLDVKLIDSTIENKNSLKHYFYVLINTLNKRRVYLKHKFIKNIINFLSTVGLYEKARVIYYYLKKDKA